MSLAVRRIIFYILLALFIIVAPSLVAYTAGYRWSPTQRRIVKIGALSIKTVPENARIILNGKLYSKKTPALITNLHPGNYKIELTREGYFNWGKTLIVESEKTTFAHNVALFKNAVPSLKTIDSISGAPEIKSPPIDQLQNFKQYKVFYDDKQDQVVVIDNDKQKRIAEIDGRSAVWREKSVPLLFVYSDHEVWQFNPDASTKILITRLIDDIEQVIPLENHEAILLIMRANVRALELDLRDRQNSWNLAQFDEIKTATLSGDGETLEILGTYEGRAGMWELELQ